MTSRLFWVLAICLMAVFLWLLMYGQRQTMIRQRTLAVNTKMRALAYVEASTDLDAARAEIRRLRAQLEQCQPSSREGRR